MSEDLEAELDDLIARCERGDESLLVEGEPPEWCEGEGWAERVISGALGEEE